MIVILFGGVWFNCLWVWWLFVCRLVVWLYGVFTCGFVWLLVAGWLVSAVLFGYGLLFWLFDWLVVGDCLFCRCLGFCVVAGLGGFDGVWVICYGFDFCFGCCHAFCLLGGCLELVAAL